MSERKNIKRNATRVPASKRAFHTSMQRNYAKKKVLTEYNDEQRKLF